MELSPIIASMPLLGNRLDIPKLVYEGMEATIASKSIAFVASTFNSLIKSLANSNLKPSEIMTTFLLGLSATKSL